MTDVVVPLSKKYAAHDKTFDKVVLREPSYAEIFGEGLGRPQEWQRAGDGTMVMVTYPSVVNEYLTRIVVEPGYDCILQLKTLDALKLERAVCDFFWDLTASKTPSTSSSSASAGRRRKSKE